MRFSQNALRWRALQCLRFLLCFFSVQAFAPLDTARACEAMLGGEYTDPPEGWSLPFADTSEWHTASRARTLSYARKQLVRPEQALHQWTELLTLEVVFGRSRSELDLLRTSYLDDFRIRCPGMVVNELARDEASLLFEWKHDGCHGAPARHGIVRMLAGTIGLHTLAYDRKGPLATNERDTWIERLRSAQLERRSVTTQNPKLAEAHWAVWSGAHARAVELASPLAERGDAEALELLGRLHMEGWGVALDVAAARKKFERAAELDLPMAAYQLGRIYDEGLGVAADPERALAWYRKAAEGGVVDARARLGVLLSSAPEDDGKREAVRWLERAVDGGHSHARYWLARAKHEGRGAAQDLSSAVELYRAAAQDGERDAQFAMGRLYADGIGVPKDDARAITWLTRAVMQGEDAAREFYHERFGARETARANGPGGEGNAAARADGKP